MKNTGTEYLSTERRPTVLEELATLLPPLSEEQRSALEADILKNGCYAPIIVNEDLAIVDGHNRHQICEEHDIPYRMTVFAFDSMLETKQWMVETQRGRRNLLPWELGKIALKLREDVEAQAKANLVAGGLSRAEEKPCLNSDEASFKHVDTRKALADSVGISRDTMSRVMKIDQGAPVSVKDALDHRELSLNQGYNITKKLQQLPEEERDQAAQEEVAWAKAQKELKKRDAETDRRTRIAQSFSKAFEYATQLDPSEENVRCWADCSRMKPSEMSLNAAIARDLAQIFLTIAETFEQKIIPTDWRVVSEKQNFGSGTE